MTLSWLFVYIYMQTFSVLTLVKIYITFTPGSKDMNLQKLISSWLSRCGATLLIVAAATISISTAHATGTISASPASCTVPAGSTTCSTSISWSTASEASASVWVSWTGGGGAAPGNLGSGLSGNVAVPWIQIGTYTFILRRGTAVSGAELARVLVNGTAPVAATGTISASPNPCSIAAGASGCSSTVSWTSSGAPNAGLFLRETGQLAAGTSSGTYTAAGWITTTGYRFDVRADAGNINSALLASVYVTGTAASPPVAAPTCTSTAPQATTTTATTGTFRVYANGVANATSVRFPTWGDTGGQDDLVWYTGVNAGGGQWYADVNLANHKAGNPEYGGFNAHAYITNSTHGEKFCGAIAWTRTQVTQPPSNTGNLISNGGFESPATSTYVYPTSNGIPSWTASGGVAIQRNGSAWGAQSAPEGLQTGVLQGSSNLSTVVNAPSAGSYNLTFHAASRTNWGGANPVVVKVNGTTVYNFTSSSGAFAQQQVNVNLAGGSNTISLSGTNASGDNSTFIDNVQLVAMFVDSPCDRIVNPGGNIAAALSSSAVIVCLAPGTHQVPNTLTVPEGKTLRGQNNNSTDSQILGSVVGVNASVIAPSAGSVVKYLTIANAASYLPNFGILLIGKTSTQSNPAKLENLIVKGHLINVGIHTSSNVVLNTVEMSNPGNPTSRAADPNLWIYGSTSINVKKVKVYGGGDPGFDSGGALTGDGEIGVYDSSNITLDDIDSIDSKTSAVYFRRCANCVIRNSRILRARGWGLDMVDSITNPNLGNDNLLVENNTISNSAYSAAILYLVGGINVTFRNNIFIDNNIVTYNGEVPQGRCSGVAIVGNAGTLLTTGNSVLINGVSQPSQERCAQ
jgi:GBS Bsp-like repeat